LDASAVHPEAYPVVEKIVGAAPWIGIKEVS
jgi:transcriptional accessory protein Tex/SPT6